MPKRSTNLWSRRTAEPERKPKPIITEKKWVVMILVHAGAEKSIRSAMEKDEKFSSHYWPPRANCGASGEYSDWQCCPCVSFFGTEERRENDCCSLVRSGASPTGSRGNA